MTASVPLGAVLYAKDLQRLGAFYSELCGLNLAEAQADYWVVARGDYQLVIMAIPQAIAASIVIRSPPVLRESQAIKLVFPVASLAEVRERVVTLGGRLNDQEREWTFQGSRVCDGCDPEGNIVQFRQAP